MGGPQVLLAALWALGAAGATALRIGAFNIQSFGDSKVTDPACGSIIAQILAGYDITLVQEVRDPDLSAVSALMELINSVSRHKYSFVSSEPLGRDQYKEMYLFVYRKDAVSVVDTYQYPDPEDAFSREPFVVKFSAPGSVGAHPAACGAASGRGGDRRSLRRVPGRDRQVGHGRLTVPGRLQRRLQLRAGARLAVRPPAQQRGLQVAHPRQRRHHRGQLRLRLRPHRGVRRPPAQGPQAPVGRRAQLPGGVRPGPGSGPRHQ